MPYAFRCNNCGHLEGAAAAGENTTPIKCRVCRKGASFDPETGAPIRHPENWTVLAALSPEEFAPIAEHHAITADEIERHEPFVTTWRRTDQAVEVIHENTDNPDACHECLNQLQLTGEYAPHRPGLVETVRLPVYESTVRLLSEGPAPRTRAPQALYREAVDAASPDITTVARVTR